jgi:nucleosome binding factor SPN SPT16 subunit
VGPEEMVKVDSAAFVSRLERLYSHWEGGDEESEELWGEADALVVVVGKDDILYSKSTTLHLWLFGYELADTLCIFCANEIHILSSKKKIEFIKPLQEVLASRADLPKLSLHTRSKGENDAEQFQTLAGVIKDSKRGKKIGVFSKDNFTGSFVEGWQTALREVKVTQVDVSAAFSFACAAKDEAEVATVKKACQVTCTVFSKYVKKEIVTIVDEEKRVKHSKLADGIEQAVSETKYLPPGMDADSLEICYSPIIQSGGQYQLKFSTVSSDEKLHFGTIVCCLGVRYKSYCSNVVRTMFVEPTKEMQDNYTFLLSVYEKILSSLKEGVKLCDVYNTALEMVEKERPELKDNFTRNAGFVTGIEFRESSLLLSPKCQLPIRKGMLFNVNIGLAGLTNPEAQDTAGKTYSLFIGDTVLVAEDGPAVELTGISKKKMSSIAIFLGDEDEEQENGPGPDIEEQLSKKFLTNRTRMETTSEDRRMKRQKELAKKVNEEAMKRFQDHKDEQISKRPKLSSNVAYKHVSSVPRDAEVQNLRIFVDRKYEAIVLPVHGAPLPFHISTIKNISKSEEGDYVYLRINFFFPGSSLGRIDGVAFPNPDATFVKEMSYRASSTHGVSAASSLVNVFHTIKEVQKRFKTREQEKREMEGVVEQEALILNTMKGNPRLKDLYMRPVIGSRRVQGTLEAHTNGLRYTTLKGDKVDLLYNNIKQAFFQPSRSEMIVLLHFHMKSPIIISKKKHRDIQFYTEVGEIVTTLGRTQHMHDRDDLMAEQAERELRAKLDSAFDNFRKKVEALPQCRVTFEKPFRELGFHGVPHRSTVLLQPTTHCLVNLTEQPPFIIVLDEVELVHFERVQFHMRNFDMVFVFKDYKKKVATVTAIPMTQLDSIRDWLNSCDKKYTEGIQSLNWTKIMKTINDDVEGFFSQGGWSFLDPSSDQEEAEEEDSEMSDEYHPSDASSVVSGVEEADSDEDYTSLSEGDTSEYEEEESEESGKDWDELEAEARKADREDAQLDHPEEESSLRSRKRPAPSKKGSTSKKMKHRR